MSIERPLTDPPPSKKKTDSKCSIILCLMSLCCSNALGSGSTFLMYGQLGEAIMSMLVGHCLSWFTPTMIYCCDFCCGLLLLQNNQYLGRP